MNVAVGSDHAGYRTKLEVVRYLQERGHAVVDMGVHSEDPVDYPDVARSVAGAVSSGRSGRGVLVCGTGLGMAIAANKLPGVRAAAVWSPGTARLAAEHNDANVLCLSGREFRPAACLRMLGAWLDARFSGGRHLRRVKKIMALEGLNPAGTSGRYNKEPKTHKRS